MIRLDRGRFVAREALCAADMSAALALRRAAFPADAAGGDAHDPHCRHVIVEEAPGGDAVCTFRVRPMPPGQAARGYAQTHYDLAGLARDPRATLELGRFCIAPGRRDADILRVAWGALVRLVEAEGAAVIFGCTSFPGCDADPHRDALALLRAAHLGPPSLRPGRRAREWVPLPQGPFDPRRARAGLPPLLRSYLASGGWVGDHGVIDREMGTLHVFTALEIDAIPPARLRALRALADRAPD